MTTVRAGVLAGVLTIAAACAAAAPEVQTMSEAQPALERARAAARAFCIRFGFDRELVDRLDGDPVQPPLVVDRSGKGATVFRWLGHGRGAPYVQVEIGAAPGDVTVHGGFGHREFGPWTP